MLKSIVATFQTVMGSSLSLSQQSAVETIHQWRSRPPHELIFDSGRREIRLYLQAVDRLQQAPPNVKGPTNELISSAMDRLRREFTAVLSRQADHHAGPVSATEWSSVADSTAYAFRYEEYVVSEPPSKDVISYLRNIVHRMNSSGKIGECIKEYKRVRKSFLQSQLKRLRFEELGRGYNTRRTVWDELKVKMELWVQVCKICVKILFKREKEMCELIFGGLGDDGNTRDECFVGTVEDFAVDLFRFAEEMSLSNQPYERMEPILGVYDAFLWVLPDSNALFHCESGKRIRNICVEISLRIENEVTRMLYDFGNALLHEISDNSDDSGGVHPSTEHVIKEINHIMRNKNMLAKLIKSTPSLTFGDQIVPQEALGDSYSGRGFLEQYLIVIVAVLKLNLEAKSRCYKNPSLGHLFMMNNLRYITRKIEESNELQDMIGDSYLMLLSEAFNSAMLNYQESTCSKFLACFKDEGLYITRCFKSRPSKTALRKRLSTFNAIYEETRNIHSQWTIPDSQLREEVTVSMSEQLVPAYGRFLEKFENNPETNVILEKNTKYFIDNLETLILKDLFSDTTQATA